MRSGETKGVTGLAVMEKVEDCSHDLSSIASKTSLDEQTEGASVPNGDLNESRNNGMTVEGKDCLTVARNTISDSGEALNSEHSDDRSQRNSSTSDSGIYGSDADHSSTRVDDESLCQSMEKCCVTKDASQEKSATNDEENGIHYVVYESEVQMPEIMRLITKDLSEPYSIYTYRYFIHNWPKLCFLAMCGAKTVGAIVCKLDLHKKMVQRGYIAMLAVDKNYRRRGIGSHLVLKAIRAMVADDCDEVVLETEITNKSALQLYENLGFVRDKRLFRYYLNGVDALRLKLWLR